jgi:predicted Zn-dependent protease
VRRQTAARTPSTAVLKRGESGEVVTILLVLAAIVAVIWGGYALIGVAADYMASKVPDSLEAKMFGGLGAKQDDWKTEPTTAAHKRAHAVYERLVKDKTGLRELDYQFFYVAEELPNAFALPGGSMGVTDGLLELVEGDVGLATVIGHELGHLQYRHSLRMMGRSLLVAGIVMIVMGGDAGFILGTAMNLAESSHSRDQELEADAYGLKLVHKLWGTTEGSLEFFQKLEADPKTKGSELLSMISTHPYTPDRIEKLRKLAAELDKDGAASGGAKAKAKDSGKVVDKKVGRKTGKKADKKGDE